MILGSTKIAGDLKVAKGGHIYASGEVNVPDLALLEASTVAPNETILFSAEDETPGTVKTSGTVVDNGVITFPRESIVSTDKFKISASVLTTAAVINTQLAEGTIVAVCKKLTSTTPSWSDDDRIYIDKPICYIYSATQSESDYDAANRFFDFVRPNRFVAPPVGTLEGITEYRLITDRTFSPD